MEKGEISEEFKTGRFYGLMRENPENVWDKFMQEEKKIQVQGVQKQVSPDLIPQGDIFSSEYMEEMISQKSVDDAVYHSSYAAAQAKTDVKFLRETVFGQIIYDTNGTIHLVVTERSGKIRGFIVAVQIYNATAETLISAEQGEEEIYRISFNRGNVPKQIFMDRRDLSGRRCYQLFQNSGVVFTLDLPEKKKIEVISAFCRLLLESGKKKYVPVHRGWFITNNNAVFCTEEETWTYVIRQKEKLWR